jgi:leucine dehydrogenase
MGMLKHMEEYGHEQVLAFSDSSVGLKGFIAVHDTTLGPGVGGVRIWPYKTEEDALTDVLRLSRAMTYKSAAAGLSLGGGKAVIILDPEKGKTDEMLEAFGRFVHSLGGLYITTTDIGSVGHDLECIGRETPYVAGLPIEKGGSGDTSIMTGLGVYLGMKACANKAWGSDSLTGVRVVMQGFGKVASHTALRLLDEGAIVAAADIGEGARARAAEMGVETLDPETVYDAPCDIFSPNALGGTINETTIPRIKAKIIAGGANNQLMTPADGLTLHKKGVIYAPDYLINAGGIINVATEIDGPYTVERAEERTKRIYDRMSEVLALSMEEDIPTYVATNRLAEERLNEVRMSHMRTKVYAGA